MIRSVDENCVVPLPGVLEQADEVPQSLINARAALMILRDLGAALGGIRKEVGNLDLGGLVKDFLDSLMGVTLRLVAKEVRFELEGRSFIYASAAVRVRGAEVEEEGPGGAFFEEIPAAFGH